MYEIANSKNVDSNILDYLQTHVDSATMLGNLNQPYCGGGCFTRKCSLFGTKGCPLHFLTLKKRKNEDEIKKSIK